MPFRGTLAVASGRLTRGQLRGPRFVRLFPDVYVPADVEITPRVRALAAFLLVERCGGVVAGYSAAELLGASCGPWHAPAEVLVPGHVRARAGLLVRRGTAAGPDVTTAAGCLATSARRTARDLARRLDLREAVVAVDALARRHRFDPAGIVAGPAADRVARVVALADRLAESPMETRLRLALHFGGLPAPQAQYRLVDRDAVVARFDLAYPAERLAVEYDGEDHEDALDRRRDIRAGRLGWYTARFTKHEIRQETALVAAVRDLLHHRRNRDATAAGS